MAAVADKDDMLPKEDMTLQQDRSPLFDGEYQAAFERSRQMAFIRKVYIVLTIQLTAAVGAAVLMMCQGSVKSYVQDNRWITFVAYGLAIATLIPMVCCFRKKAPWNAVLLAVFTLCMSFVVGVVCSFYDTDVVLKAFLITLSVFLLLTLYTVCSKHDFHFLGAGLFVALWVLLFAGLMQLWLPYDNTLQMVYAGAGALIFSLFIVYDTNKIWKRYEELGDEEWLVATIDLYLDVINLFLFILRLLGGSGGRK